MSVQSVLFVHLACLYRPPPHALGEFMRGWEPLPSPMQALRESMAKPCSAPRVTFSPMRKSPKNLPEGDTPLWVLPLGGYYHPPSSARMYALAAPPRKGCHSGRYASHKPNYRATD